MVGYVGAVWHCRYFWLTLVKMDLRTRYRRSVLGLGWSLLHPIAMTTVLCTMFAHILDVDTTVYAPYLLAGLVCWNFILNTTLLGCQCMFQGEAYIRQHPAPLAIYPLRTALGGLVHFVLALLVLLLLSWYINGFGNLPYLIYLLPAIGLFFILAWSLATLVGFANVFFQDTQHLCEVGFQILFYSTPIIYRVDDLRKKSLEWVAQANPLVAFLNLVREPVLGLNPSLGPSAPSAETLLIATGTAMLLFAAAALTLARQQRRLIFHL